MAGHLLGHKSAPAKPSRSLHQVSARWHPRCRAPTFRVAELRHKQAFCTRHGAVYMAAAVEVPEAQKDKYEEEQKAPAAKHHRREEAILFQGDNANSQLLRS